MRKVISLILISFIIPVMLFGCKDNVTKGEAMDVAVKFTELILTSDTERFSKLKETDFYKEAPEYGYELGYEALFMYLPGYKDICSADTLEWLGRDFALNAFIIDEYAERHGYEKIVPEDIKTTIYAENDNTYTVRVDVVLNRMYGEVSKKTSFSLYVDILHNEEGYYDCEAGDIVGFETYEHLLMN